tara:strand:+ start:254 stop:820 length:567 start_codon:yes stop_codon:yes gene_type:complete
MKRIFSAIISILLVAQSNAFINEMIKERPAFKLKLAYDAPPTIPPKNTLFQELGGGGEEIRHLTREQAKLVLEMWTLNIEWNTQETQLMKATLETENDNDLFFGYCPEVDEQYSIRYMFHSRIIKGERPYLSVTQGIKCPFDISSISSYGFKAKLIEAIPIIPISFITLLQNQKFNLSWKIEEMNQSK